MQETPYDPSATSRYAPTTWGGSPYTEITVPSGQLCLVRKLQPMDLVAGDALGGTDLLSGIIAGQIEKAKAGPQDHKKPRAQQDAEDNAKLADALGKVLSSPESLDSMIDTVVVRAIVEPAIVMPPKDFTDRKDGVVYVDTISFGDKMHVFNWVMGGIDQLKQFREQASGGVEAVASVEGVSDPTE